MEFSAADCGRGAARPVCGIYLPLRESATWRGRSGKGDGLAAGVEKIVKLAVFQDCYPDYGTELMEVD
jgi:hypothetical protein